MIGKGRKFRCDFKFAKLNRRPLGAHNYSKGDVVNRVIMTFQSDRASSPRDEHHIQTLANRSCYFTLGFVRKAGPIIPYGVLCPKSPHRFDLQRTKCKNSGAIQHGRKAPSFRFVFFDRHVNLKIQGHILLLLGECICTPLEPSSLS